MILNNKKNWKVVPRTEIYTKGYDKIFRKIFCNTCGLQVCDVDGKPNSEKEYICINCMDRFFNEMVNKGE
jgi:transcription elongation factor Elf1